MCGGSQPQQQRRQQQQRGNDNTHGQQLRRVDSMHTRFSVCMPFGKLSRFFANTLAHRIASRTLATGGDFDTISIRFVHIEFSYGCFSRSSPTSLRSLIIHIVFNRAFCYTVRKCAGVLFRMNECLTWCVYTSESVKKHVD